MREVHLDDVDEPASMNPGCLPIVCARSPEAIGRRVAARTAQRRRVFRRDRLLDPFRIVGLDERRDLGGRRTA